MLVTLKDILIIGGSAIGFLIVTVLGKRWGWYELLGGTNKLLREQNLELRNSNILFEQKIKLLEQELVEATKKNEEVTRRSETDREEFAVKHEANVKALSLMQGQIDILKNIPLGNIDSTLIEIRDTLKSSAVVLALDTKDVAEKAREVKSNLSKNDTAVADAATIVKLTLLKNTADAALAAALVKTTLEDKNV
jgi:hypothetical protein